MAETTQPPGLDRKTEEEAFYHEAALNGTWTASRLAVGGLCFLFGSFVFAYFYLRSLNSGGRWQGSGYHPPSMVEGTVVMLLVLVSAALQYAGLERAKAGNKRLWQILGLVALACGVAAVTLQIIELLFLPFYPGSSGYSSVFTGFYAVFVVILVAVMIWLESLLVQSRAFPAMSFVEQPPTYREAFALQRFQANLSAFTLVWNFIAVMAILFWVLFYAL